MSYVVRRTVYKLVFPDSDYEGLEIRVRAMSMGERLHAAFDLGFEQGDSPQVRKDKQHELHQMFVDHLVDWNLTEEDDTPIPTTMEGLLSLEPEFLGTLVGVWQVGRAAIPAPLEQNSTGGDLSPVESTLTGIPSESLAS